MVANTIDRKREGKREQVQLQVPPTIHRPGRPDALAQFKYRDTPEEGSDFVITDGQLHKKLGNQDLKLVLPTMHRFWKTSSPWRLIECHRNLRNRTLFPKPKGHCILFEIHAAPRTFGRR